METLSQLEYHFNDELKLRHIQTGEGFKFVDQGHYEKLADAVAEHIQEIMVKGYNMIKIEVPFAEDVTNLEEDTNEDGTTSACCPVFVSSNYKEADVVVVLLCGTGRVVAGQWARKLCINDSLKTGSVLPFLDWAKEHSFGVIVLNPNKTFVETEEGLTRAIPLNESAEAHVNYVWQAVCNPLPAKHFVLVAHSYGGVSTCSLLKHQGEAVLQRMRCIAFTDSAHSGYIRKVLSDKAKVFLAKHCINWASSPEALDTGLEMPLERRTEKQESRENEPERERNSRQMWLQGSMCKVVSAGTEVHEETTMSAFPSICKFILDNLLAVGVVCRHGD